MLTIYKGRENIDKERFIYENISGETIVIVPNQYTLIAEEQALKYMGKKCLFDVEIMSMNRLGLRVLTEKGLESTKMLDKYGRFMLLSRIIKEHSDTLKTFGRSAGKLTFASMINDFIADYKQQDCTMEELQAMMNSDADELLQAKLAELGRIVCEYETAIDGLYIDSEDYIAMYVDAIKDSTWLCGKTVWIYGYDSVTPKFLSAMAELTNKCKNVNLIVNESDFNLDDIMLGRIRSKLAEAYSETQIEGYRLEKSRTIEAIEAGLFNDDMTVSDWEPEDIEVIRAANPYYEAENAAIYVSHLLRDCGYKMRDIQIIANDEGTMQPIIRRVFEEYGLPVFMDQSRAITDSAVVSFIIGLLKFARYKKTEDLMAMLKSGFAGVQHEDIENLENYANRFHIKHSMWDRQFKFGKELVGEETFDRVENLRGQLADCIAKIPSCDANYSDWIDSLIAYFNDVWNLPQRVADAVEEQSNMTFYEEAQRTAESYKSAMDLLEQMKQIMGDEKVELSEFIDIYMAGLSNVEVGVIPPTADGLSMGTIIRTRPRSAKAVVILGANEGVLPLEPSTEGLFSIDEKSYFKKKGFALGSLDDIKMTEEQVAMYRMLSKPSEKLYVSYSLTDADGEDKSPSSLIDALQDLFPKLTIKKDVISEGWNDEMITSPNASMRHLINHLKDRNAPSQIDELSSATLTWYENNEASVLEEMLAAAQNENDPKPLGNNIAGRLYSRKDGVLVLSASSINNYNDCPFRFYIDKGIKPEEERKFESDPRSIGDVYHEFLMNIALKILANKDYGINLLECSDEELEAIVQAELAEIGNNYQGGLFISSGTEQYRMDRIKEVCILAVRSLAGQLAAESVTDAKFEESFGRGKKFAPLEFEVDGQKVYVEGKIDRVDILNDNRVRIVDYKTGSDKFDPWKVEHGYKMQLMIYMMSATTHDYEPAGMFYFNIEDTLQSANDPKKFKEIDFKLKGRYVDEPGVADAMPLDVIASAKEVKMSREEYDSLKDNVAARIGEIAGGIASGVINIKPLKPDNVLVCNVCKYKSICKRDREYVRNQAREIPTRPNNKKEEQ